MTLHKFRPEFIYYQPVENHEQHKQLILSTIQQEVEQRKFARAQRTNIPYSSQTLIYEPDTPTDTAGGKTQINYTPQFMNDVVTMPTINMLNEIKSEFNITTPTIKEPYLKDIWWNYYLPGKHTAPHIHVDTDFSGIYIVECNEPNPTQFKQSLRSVGPLPLYEEYYSSEDIKEGHVMIFPSSLLHWVNPCQSERCSVIFNIMIDYTFEEFSAM